MNLIIRVFYSNGKTDDVNVQWEDYLHMLKSYHWGVSPDRTNPVVGWIVCQS